jgi:phage shock protein A
LLKKWINYIKAWFTKKSNDAMDPEIEIEMAIQDAQKKDQQLRNQAAQVIAHRTQLAAQLESSAGTVAEARELAKQALLKADASTKAGNAADAEKWNAAATSLAMRLQTAQSTMDMLQKQLVTADKQAEDAKRAVQVNASSVQELAAKRMKLLGELQATKMQERVNDAMATMSATSSIDTPSLGDVEQKIQARKAQASAKAELASATPEGAMAELKRSTAELQASATLDSLRAELGLTSSPAPAGELAAPSTTPPPEPQSGTPAS